MKSIVKMCETCKWVSSAYMNMEMTDFRCPYYNYLADDCIRHVNGEEILTKWEWNGK